MEPKLTPYTTQILRKESHFTLDSVEEIDSECDISSNQNQTANLSKTSSDLKCSGDIQKSASSINSSILDDTQEVKILKERMYDLEAKCRLLEIRNDKLDTELTAYKIRNQKLERKLQFVKDNQEVFIRLKEAYVNMKYNEAAGRKMVEIREKGVQTWDGILCRGCIQAEEIRRHVEGLREMYSDSYIIATFEMDQLNTTVKYLKDLIDRREKSWECHMERENKLHARTKALEHENSTLRNILKRRKINVEDVQFEDSLTETPNKEIVQLRKIIIKFDKKFRELEKSNAGINLVSPLNDKEKKMIHLIVTKYNARLRKSSDRLRSQSTSRETKQENLKLIHNLKLDVSCPKLKSVRSQTSIGFKCAQNEGTAIMMMDELFSSETQLV